MPKRKLKDTEITGALKENMYPDGRRKLQLTKADKKALMRQQTAEAAAALFLDLNESRTWPEIAHELDMSVHSLKELTKTPEFNVAYNALFPELGHDPRYKAAQGALSDMLPEAISRLRTLLTNEQTPPSVRMKAIEKVISLNEVSQPGSQHSDRQEMVRFLTQNNIQIDTVNMAVPQEYQQALEEYAEVQPQRTEDPILEGELLDIETPADA